MLNYINSVRINNGKSALSASDDQAEARGEIHCFLNKTTPWVVSSTLSYGCDYSSDAVGNGFWKTATIKTETNTTSLMKPTRSGYVFGGWYENQACNGEQVAVATNNETLYAKWISEDELALPDYKVTYNLNGGSLPGIGQTVTVKDSFLIGVANKSLMSGLYNTDAAVFSNSYTATDTSTYKFFHKVGFSYDSSKGYYVVDHIIPSGTELKGNATSEYYVLGYEDATDATAVAIYKQILNLEIGDLIQFNKTLNNDANASFDATLSVVSVSGVSSVIYKEGTVLPTPTKLGYKFMGYYDNALFTGDPIVTVRSDVTLYAKWEIDNNEYKVKFELNGGFFTTYNGSTLNDYRTAVVNDLHSDINTFTGRSFGLATFFANTYNANDNYMDRFFQDATYGAKWGWLLNYINSVRSKAGKAALTAGSAAAQYRGEIHCFLNSSAPSADSSNYGSDYSSDLHGYRFYLSDKIASGYSSLKSGTSVSTLPTPIRLGGDFVGYYTDAELTQPVTTITGDCTLYAQYKTEGSGYFNLSFASNAWVTRGSSMKINASFTSYNGDNVTLEWKSLDENIATVSGGTVTGVSEGNVKIKVYVVGEENSTFEVISIPVVSSSQSVALQTVLSSHENEIFIKENLPVGSGTPAYYANIYGSVSKLLYNESLSINTTYLATGNAAGNNSGTMSSIDFITVHYTGNMASGANAKANASYFVGSTDSSIHYTTGNDGVYQCMNENLKAWHAGTGNAFSWSKTNVAYSSTDPKYPTFGINSSSNFTINGKDTGIKVPYDDTRGYGYVTDSKWLNDMGVAYKVTGGYYYIGNTHWQYNQVWEGRICSNGGNNNSIGIESCVNQGSDLWYTWQKTAQLVAKIMKSNNLGIERVVGHHFFTAKDCPQPMLENDLEIWWEFKDLVEAEYTKLTKLSGYTITMSTTNNYVNSKGRITSRPSTNQVIDYTVTITNNSTGAVEIVTLSSFLRGTIA